MLHISVLGEFRVRVGDREVAPSEWKRRKAAAIVKVLALAPGHRLHREQMMDVLWPELDPDQAANSLYQALYAVRRALDPAGSGEQIVFLRDGVVQIDPGIPVRVDALEFEDAVAEARGRRDRQSCALALERYTGDLLPDDRYEPWAAERRELLRDAYISLVLDLADSEDGTGDPAGTIAALRKIVADDPLNEPAQRALMRLYARSGQRQLAVRQYQSLSDTLASELDVEPEPESEALFEQIRAGQLAGPAERTLSNAATGSQPLQRHNLPSPVSSFIGREREVAEIGKLLRAARLLTLTGPGGCGKSRLSLEVAGDLLDEFDDGVWLVELASLTDPALIPQTIAAALDTREMPGQPLIDMLQSWLKARRALIVLDNCEHLIDACATIVASLLRSSPGLRVLATSREPLRIDGERTWLVPSLSLPDPRRLDGPDELLAYESVQLFHDRARQNAPEFTITPGNAAAVASLCYRLDGIPLAIELAAARLRTLDVDQIVERLGDRFQLLSGGSRSALSRQQTLRAALDWSYDLLSEPERVLFSRLAIFAGGFDLVAAESVCGAEPLHAAHVVDLLMQLVDRSLVVVDEAGGAKRYHLLETMREYARERLVEREEPDLLRCEHAHYYADLATQVDGQIRGAGSRKGIARLEGEHDNLRAALEWCHEAALAGEPEAGLLLAGTMHWFWQMRGHFSEGREWLMRMLAAAGGKQTRGAALSLTGVGELSLAVGEYSEGRVLLDQSIAIWRGLSDPFGLAVALSWSGHAELFHGRVAEARARHREALVLFTGLNHAWGMATATLGLGLDAVEVDDHALAAHLFDGSLAIFRELHDDWGTVMTLQHMANLTYRTGDFVTARAQIDEVLALEQRMGDTWLEVHTQSLLGEVARAGGDYETAGKAVEKGFEIAKDLLHFVGIVWISRDAGFVALAAGDLDEARARFRESLALFQLRQYPLGMTCCLVGMAGVAALEERYELAARILGAVEAALTEIGLSLAPADRIEAERISNVTREALGSAVFESARSEGKTLNLLAAVAEVDSLL